MTESAAVVATGTPIAYAQEHVGFIGLGNMGLPMSLSLSSFLSLHSLPPLTIFNRTPSKLPPPSSSIIHATSLRQVVETCSIIITSLSSDEVVESVYEELFEAVREKVKGTEGRRGGGKRTYFVESSTVYPHLAGKLEREASLIPHVYYLQCPVFGEPDIAERSELLWVLSGDVFAKRQVAPFLVPSMGRKLIDVGSNVERAAAFKLNGNFFVLGILETLAEGLTLADKTGVGAELMLEFIKDIIPSSLFPLYTSKMIHNSFAGNTGFTVEGGLKDANHLRHLAASVHTTIPVIDLAHNSLITSWAAGGKEKDWSSLVAGPRVAAGLGGFTGLKEVPRDSGFGAKVDKDDDNVKIPVPDGGIKSVQNF